MNKKIILASLIAIAISQKAIAQFHINAVSGTTATGIPLTAPTTNNNVIVGAGSGTNGSANTFLGYSVAPTNQGDWNTFLGWSSGQNNNLGSQNTFVGLMAGLNNTDGDYNSFLGTMSGMSNTTGVGNTFIGKHAGSGNTTGTANIMVGVLSGLGSTTGQFNIGIGSYCAAQNSTGSENIFIGVSSGSTNTSGNSNVFIGRSAGQNNITGSFNSVLGPSADFRGSNYTNAHAIGSYAHVAQSNSMVLGGTDTSGYAVQVGIGTEKPEAKLHLESFNADDIMLVNTRSNANKSIVNLRAGSGTGSLQKDMELSISSTGATGPFPGGILPTVGAAPAINYNNLGIMAAKSSSLFIGTYPTAYSSPNSPDYAQNIHFVTGVENTIGGGLPTLKPWECIRVNKLDGFVGIHTRTATSSGSSGNPKALFHVNLTNSAQPIIKATQGIRFEGLPDYDPLTMAAHNDVIVIDADGNLAKSNSGGFGVDWHLTGNWGVSATDYIGTNNVQDFRIHTSNTPRARFTADGNFEMGIGNTFSSTSKSSAFGETNNINSSISTLASGIGNIIDGSNYSTALGWQNSINASSAAFSSGRSNIIDNTSDYSSALGNSNIIDGSVASMSIGQNNSITTSSNNSAVLGNSNQILSSSNALANGTSNIVKGANNSLSVGESNQIDASTSVISTGYQNKITVTSNNSSALGTRNEIKEAKNSFAAGDSNVIFTNKTKEGCIALGAKNIIENSEESVIAGESNYMEEAHGTFVAGGHNSSNGAYNIVLGHNSHAVGENAHAYGNEVVANGTNVLALGHDITNDKLFSLAIGFKKNRTMVVNETGVNIQWNPTSPSTYLPKHHLDVEAAFPAIYRSNIAFHNLPDHDPSIALPAVLIDPSTGELFKSTTTHYIVTPPTSSESVISDEKINTNVKEITNSLELINKLQPDIHQFDKAKYPSLKFGTNNISYGISAQNVESVLPSLVKEIEIPNKEDEKIKCVNYTELIPIIVQAIKDQQKQINEQNSVIIEQKKLIEQLIAIVKSNDEILQKQNESVAKISVILSEKDSCFINQNIPNPCDRKTSVSFYLPNTIQNAAIRFTTIEGKIIELITLKERGKGQVDIYTTNLSQGIYYYTLIADGQVIDTKKMEITR